MSEKYWIIASKGTIKEGDGKIEFEKYIHESKLTDLEKVKMEFEEGNPGYIVEEINRDPVKAWSNNALKTSGR